jgi:hypothetical protein
MYARPQASEQASLAGLFCFGGLTKVAIWFIVLLLFCHFVACFLESAWTLLYR